MCVAHIKNSGASPKDPNPPQSVEVFRQVINGAMTLLKPFPVGLIITLISALILFRKTNSDHRLVGSRRQSRLVSGPGSPTEGRARRPGSSPRCTRAIRSTQSLCLRKRNLGGNLELVFSMKENERGYRRRLWQKISGIGRRILLKAKTDDKSSTRMYKKYLGMDLEAWGGCA